jgi:hypothetical protein
MRHLSLALVLVCCACSQADEQAAAPPPTAETATPEAAPEASKPAPAAITKPAALGPAGLGAIVVGQAPPASLKADAVQISEGCQTHTDKVRGLSVMTDGKVVTRITAMRTSKVLTAQGIGLGASEAQVRSAYPDAREEPHKYVAAPAKYLDWRPGGGDTGLRFEINEQGKVGMIHAGRDPYLSYVEGCA